MNIPRAILPSAVLMMVSLVLTGCQTDQKFSRKSKTDSGYVIRSTDYGMAADPFVNAFKYLKDFDRIEESQRSTYNVIRQKYFQNDRYTMSVEFVTNGFFGVDLFETVLDKKKSRKHLERVRQTQLMQNGFKVYKSYDVAAVYASSGDCAFIRFAKKLKEPKFDNDQGNPDFHGTYSGCGGLTVSPLEFIKSIEMATDVDYALYADKIKAKLGPRKDQTIAGHGDQGICYLAGSMHPDLPYMWSQSWNKRKYLKEARARGLTEKSCAKLLKRPG